MLIMSTHRKRARETYQRQQALRLPNRSAISEEAEEEHQTADSNENVNALINQLWLGESLKGKQIELVLASLR